MRRPITHFLAAAVACCTFTACTRANELAIGKAAKIKGPIQIPIAPPADFNFKPVAQIMAMRKAEVNKYAALLKSDYKPNSEVFGQVEDRKPWWGTIGMAFYGRGSKSIIGPAEESRFVLNPFLLAGNMEIIGLDRRRIREADLLQMSYPTFYQPAGLRWWPDQGKAEVTYHVSSLESQLASMLGYSRYDTRSAGMGLELINARDLGLNYVYIPPAWAYNIEIGSPMRGIISIPQFIHCGGSCGYPGGCNNMSPARAELDRFKITKLPARLVLMFWANAPAKGEPPDMTYTINYQ